MPYYRYTGNHDFRLNDEESIEPGSVVELSESSVEGHEGVFEEVQGPEEAPVDQGNGEESEPDSSEDAESAAESESEGEEDDSPEEDQEAAESETEAPEEETETDGGLVELPLDPGDLTNDQLEAELGAGDFSDAELDAILSAEEDGKDRKGAKEVIESAKGG